MAIKNTFAGTLVAAQDLATTNTKPLQIDMLNIDILVMHYVWTGSGLTTTLTMTGSNDGINYSSWTVTLPTISGSSGGSGWATITNPPRWLKSVNTASAGTGTLNIYGMGRSI